MYSKTYTTDARCVLRVYVSVEYSRMTVNIYSRRSDLGKTEEEIQNKKHKNIHLLK